METTIRNLTEKDFPEFEKVFKETILSEFKPYYSQKVLEFFTEEKYLQSMWHQQIKLGAFQGENLVGYIVCDKHVGGIAYVFWLAILKKYQHQGIGTHLLEDLESILKQKGVHAIHLQAAKHNIPFYKKLGYTVFGFDDAGYFAGRDYYLRKLIQEMDEKNFFL